MSEILTPQFNPDSGEVPAELSALRELALDHHKTVVDSREIVRCREAYMGRYYQGETVLPWKPSAVHPKVHEVVERFTSVLTDSRVKFAPKPRNDEDAILAEAMIAGADYEWERQRMDLKMQVASRAVLIDGTTMLYVCRDSDGRPQTKVLSPFSFVPDPTSTNEDDMNYGFVRFGMTRTEIESKWPEMAGVIFERVHHGTNPLRDEGTYNASPAPGAQPGQFGTITAAGGDAQNTEFASPQTARGERGRSYRVEEWWFKRGEDKVLTVDLADGQSTTIEMPAMTGRRLYVIEGHYFPELDGANPHEHGMIPVCRMTSIMLQNEFMGLPFIQPGLDTAEQIADIDNQIMANVRLMMHPIWLVPFESRVDISKFFSAPGVVLPYRAPHKPEAHTPPALPQYVFELRQIKQIEFDNAMGLNDISRGNYSGGLDDVSGKAVQLLQRPTYTRMRPIQMSMEYAITRWGRLTMCDLMQYGDEDLWRRFLPAEIADMPLPWIENIEGKPLDSYLPEISMAAGSNLPENQDQKNSLAMNLHDKGAFGPPGTPIPAKELLKATQYPDAERVGMNTEMAYQQQAMMMMPPSPVSPGGPNKALGGERSPEDDMNVAAGMEGQEEGL